jgi:predicted GNAT family N-acyltransferase
MKGAEVQRDMRMRIEGAMIRIRSARWGHDQPALRLIRHEVFVDVQSVPAADERDGLDANARHWIAETEAGEPIGTVRLLPSAQIGRMVVRAGYRGQGVGTALLEQVLGLTTQRSILRMTTRRCSTE